MSKNPAQQIDWSRVENDQRFITQDEVLTGNRDKLIHRYEGSFGKLDLPFDVEPFLRDPIGFILEKKKRFPTSPPKRPSLAGCNFSTRSLGELLGVGSAIGFATMMEQALKKAPGCLRGADFESSVLIGIDFTKADLRDANFRRSSLAGLHEKANFSGADLRGADFKDSDLKNASIRGVSKFKYM